MDINVKKIANLSRIRLTPSEADELAPQLSSIMGYIDKLSEVNTDGVRPTAHPHDVAMPQRPDIASNPNRRDALQQPSPRIESGLYVVPKVIE